MIVKALDIRRYVFWIAVFGLFALVTICLSPLFGAEPVNPFRALWSALRGVKSIDSVEVDIFLNQRLPRILLALATGGTLALAGAVFQAMLRNPLAEPYTLGLSGGAAFGAVVAISFSSLDVAWGPFAGVQVLALLGAFFNIGVVYLLARKKGSISSSALLLAGVTLGLISGSGILFVRYLTRPDLLVNMDRWLMGGLSVLGYRKLVSILPLLVPGVALLLWHGRDYNQLVLGEEMAAGRGVNVASLRRISFFGGSLITAAVVAVAGPIGFVGLLVPHIIRRLIGNDHRLLLPCAFLGGGGFLVICDTFARTIVAPTELPVGIVTALLGGPFFLYLLVRLR